MGQRERERERERELEDFLLGNYMDSLSVSYNEIELNSIDKSIYIYISEKIIFFGLKQVDKSKILSFQEILKLDKF